jgi:hypothetical protein
MESKWLWLAGGAAFGFFVWPTLYGMFFPKPA